MNARSTDFKPTPEDVSDTIVLTPSLDSPGIFIEIDANGKGSKYLLLPTNVQSLLDAGKKREFAEELYKLEAGGMANEQLIVNLGGLWYEKRGELEHNCDLKIRLQKMGKIGLAVSIRKRTTTEMEAIGSA